MHSNGEVDSDIAAFNHGARPAFNFNLNSVLFSSAAAGGKSTSAAGALDAPASNTTNEWKLTLLDGNRTGFAVTEAPAAALGGTVTLTYSGAATGTNEYVSALLCDSTGAAIAYGGVPVAQDNKATFTLPDSLTPGSYTLKVFNEQRNDDYLSDYAGNPVTVALTVKQTIAPAVMLADWTYGEAAKTPAVTGNTGSGAVTYAYKAKNAEDTAYVADVPVNAGEYTVRATVAETANYIGGTATADFTIAPKPVTITGVTLSQDSYSYDGTTKTPTATVKDGDTPLTSSDYTVAYSNNTDPGTATVTVTGKGNYSGTASKTFQIYGVKGAWSGSKLMATAHVATPANALLIAAVYDKNGKQVDVKVVELEANKTAYETGVTAKTSGYTYKLMVVSKSTYAPLCAATTVCRE